MEDDLHQLRVVVTGGLHRLDVGVADMPSRDDDLGGEAQRRVGLGIARAALAVRRDLGIVELGEVLSEYACAERQ